MRIRLDYRVGLIINTLLFLTFLLVLGSRFPVAEYEGDNGLIIKSYTAKWKKTEQLEAVYRELLNNQHGEEIKCLKAIHLYPNKRDVAAYYFNDFKKTAQGIQMGKKARIEIYNMSSYSSVEEFARIISHEYGHHFTTYYILSKEGLPYNQWLKSSYVRVRGLINHPQVIQTSKRNNAENHAWDLTEIAAEDYVQLLGSDTGKNWVDYKDVLERLIIEQESYSYSSLHYNLYPQENLSIPLAADVEGLYDYWHNMLYGHENDYAPIKLIQRELSIRPIEYTNDFTSYKVQWLPVPNVEEYTLVLLKQGENVPEPIKTLTSKEPLEAVLGCGILKSESGSLKVIKQDLQGEYRLILFGKDLYGYVHIVGEKNIVFTD